MNLHTKMDLTILLTIRTIIKGIIPEKMVQIHILLTVWTITKGVSPEKMVQIYILQTIWTHKYQKGLFQKRDCKKDNSFLQSLLIKLFNFFDFPAHFFIFFREDRNQ